MISNWPGGDVRPTLEDPLLNMPNAESEDRSAPTQFPEYTIGEFARGIVFLAFLPVILVLAVPFCLLVTIAQFREERRFRHDLRMHNRVIEWKDLVPRLETGAGTLIVEQGQKRPARIWWTVEDVLGLAPHQPPTSEELDILCVEPPNPFVAWCHDRYLDAETGKGLLSVPSFKLPPGLFFADFFKERYPRLQAIDTVYVRSWAFRGHHAK